MRKTGRIPRELNASALSIAVGVLAVHQIRETGALNIGHTRIVRLHPAAKQPAAPEPPQAKPEAIRGERP